MSKPSAPKLLLIDNYDSFTYNLVQAFLVLGAEVRVLRNDEVTVDEALRMDITHLCISPGPGTPRDAGVSMDMIRAFAGKLPVFGVCLGHQSIVEVFGGEDLEGEVAVFDLIAAEILGARGHSAKQDDRQANGDCSNHTFSRELG